MDDLANAMQFVEDIINNLDDSKVIHSFYVEFKRRLEVLKLVKSFCSPGSTVLDLGAQPFIISCTLKKMGYRVIAFDIEPEPYMKIANTCGVDVVKCDLEKDKLTVSEADCAVFSEVLEHLHYYYVPKVLAKINRALKNEGCLILTTPNIASLFRRLRLLLGKQPIYKYHVREYTMSEIIEMVREAGFDIAKAYYSIVNDLAFVDAETEDYKKINGYADLLRITVRKPTRLNILRALTYPLVKAVPSLRNLIVIIGTKTREPKAKHLERWG